MKVSRCIIVALLHLKVRIPACVGIRRVRVRSMETRRVGIGRMGTRRVGTKEVLRKEMSPYQMVGRG